MRHFALCLFVYEVMSLGSQAASTMVVTYEAAKVMSSPVQSSYTYDFNSVGLGIKSNVSWTGWGGTGTFTSVRINSFDVYGGANSSNYTFANDSTQTTLNLSTGISYFGMWWSAGDPGNVLDFYSGASKIFTFTSSVMNSLGSAYNGNPNSGTHSGGNNGEKYAFINFLFRAVPRSTKSSRGAPILNRTTGPCGIRRTARWREMEPFCRERPWHNIT